MRISLIIESTATLVLTTTITAAASVDEPDSSSTHSEQLWITNAHGDDIHIYEVGSWKLVGMLQVGPGPHGISATADGATIHVSIEHSGRDRGELVWIDAKSREIIGRLDVGPAPHEIECTPDGRWIYVPCNDGTWWVVDGFDRSVLKRILTDGRPHNTTISPDGQRMYLSPMGLKVKIDGKSKWLGPERVTVVAINESHKVLGEIEFSDHPRPVAISPDGRWLYHNVDDVTGFEIADTSTFKFVETIEHEIHPELKKRKTRCHGLALKPDGSEIWCCDVDRHRVHVHELQSGSYEQVATISLKGRVYWITMSLDGTYAFASLRSEGCVAVIDTTTREVVTHLEAGDTPKRTLVIRIPTD